jgi:hypothetical protein
LLSTKNGFFDTLKEKILSIDEKYTPIYEVIEGMLKLEPNERISIEDSLKILNDLISNFE